MTVNAFEVPQVGNRPINKRDWKRAYMACERCRNTKAKCEISPDSNACVKCVRERRECVYATERSTKRRKKDAEGAGSFAADPQDFLAAPKDRPRLPARHRSSANVQRQDSTSKSSDEPLIDTVVSSSRDALGILFKAAEQQDTDESDEQGDVAAKRAYDSPTSAFTTGLQIQPIQPSPLSKPTLPILNLWNQHRFVRQGWFSAVEGVTYIDLFFKNLSSLSPVSSSFYADHRNHRSLILEEPLLCCTLLMISSRYHVLPGPGGATRADFIHMRLWKHCEHLIQKITFGQEKYSSAKSRTLGSIKALLLMTEWHPRSLHFPPETDGWDASLAPSIDDQYGNTDRSGNNAHSMRWREEVFEPAKRSDRMSWMLLGLATTLAHELGVFEDPDQEEETWQVAPHNRVRTRRILFLYVNQLSLRLGCTSFLPQSISMSLTPPSVETYDAATKDRDALITHWIDITKLRKTTTEMFFSSKSATRQIMSTSRYIALLEHFHPLLAQWKRSFDDLKLTTLPPASKQMLLVDYGYVRMYINSIAIQAVVERAKTHASKTALDFDFLKNDHKQDYKYIQEVIDASRSVLATAVELGDADMLRYAPVRVFIRVASAAVFLLKAISLGTSKSELRKSLEVLDKCIHALRYKTTDDMHLSSRYGLLLDRHVRRFKRNFRMRNGQTVPPTPQSNERDSNGNTGVAAPENDWHTTFGDPNAQVDMSAGAFDLPLDLTTDMDNWLAQPFDPSFAPFGAEMNQGASGLESESLDFLWNLPA